MKARRFTAPWMAGWSKESLELPAKCIMSVKPITVSSLGVLRSLSPSQREK